MKANKALKRIAKIEELTSDVIKRFSKGAPPVSEVLADLKAAVARVKEAVSARVSSQTAKKKEAQSRKKTAIKKAAVKAPKAKKAKQAKKVAPVKRTAKKAAAKRTAPAQVHAGDSVFQEVTPSN